MSDEPKIDSALVRQPRDVHHTCNCGYVSICIASRTLREQRDGLLEAAKNALTLLECFKVSTSIEDQLRKAIGRCGEK